VYTFEGLNQAGVMATIRSFDRTEEIESRVLRPDRFRQLFSGPWSAEQYCSGAGLNYCIAGGVAEGHTVLSTRFNRFIAFDEERCTVRVEPGVTMGELLNSLSPATSSLRYCQDILNHRGGALAMNIHGKNQHRFGNFGNHVGRLTSIIRNTNR